MNLLNTIVERRLDNSIDIFIFKDRNYPIGEIYRIDGDNKFVSDVDSNVKSFIKMNEVDNFYKLEKLKELFKLQVLSQ